MNAAPPRREIYVARYLLARLRRARARVIRTLPLRIRPCLKYRRGRHRFRQRSAVHSNQFPFADGRG